MIYDMMGTNVQIMFSTFTSSIFMFIYYANKC